jgi:hypothetical protein
MGKSFSYFIGQPGKAHTVSLSTSLRMDSSVSTAPAEETGRIKEETNIKEKSERFRLPAPNRNADETEAPPTSSLSGWL